MQSYLFESLRDHTFGDLDDPTIGAAYQRKRNTGVHHYGQKRPLQPKPDEQVQLVATTSTETAAQCVLLQYTLDDWRTSLEIPFTKADLYWDTLSWGWLQRWQVNLPVQSEETLMRYQVFAQQPAASSAEGEVVRCYADNQANSAAEATQYAIWYSQDKVPEWSRTARIYQIFVDRFNPGEGMKWLQTQDLAKPFGGTLRGVIEKLPYIHDLGFNAIWLSPIFTSPSHHGYDTSDYEQIEPRLGTQADFEALVAQAHELGIRIILDFVANHVSNQHPAFQAALQSPESPYKDWFYWNPWPHYRCYFDVPEMPELRLTYGAPARKYLLEVAQKWLRLGIDGYRLDYASGPELDFWVDFRRACREVNPESWLFGEVTKPADEQLSFSGGLDGTLDFLTCQALRETFAFQSWSLSRFAGYLQDSLAYFPRDFSRPSFLDNHDMNRFLFAAANKKERLKLALTLLYMLPGQPLVYFGTETCLSQPRSIHDKDSIGFDQARLPMNWNEVEAHQDIAMLLRQLAALRERFPQVVAAQWKLLMVDNENETAFWQISMPEANLYLALNRSESQRSLTVSHTLLPAGAQIFNEITLQEVSMQTAQLWLPAESAFVFRIKG
jgi:cyclomaltodextrinase